MYPGLPGRIQPSVQI